LKFMVMTIRGLVNKGDYLKPSIYIYSKPKVESLTEHVRVEFFLGYLMERRVLNTGIYKDISVNEAVHDYFHHCIFRLALKSLHATCHQ